MKPFRSLICIGECMLELQLSDPQTTSAYIAFAGDSLNTAIYAKRSQPVALNVAYATALGTDAISDRMISFMMEEGIDISHVRRTNDRIPGSYAILNRSDGERSFLYWREQSAARTWLSTDAATILKNMGAFDAWYLSGISLAILPPDDRTVLLRAIQDFRKAGGQFIFDSNYRPQLWASRIEAQKTIGQAWSMCDIALPSIDDEMALFEDDTEERVVERLSNFGVTFGVLKRGDLGPSAIGWKMDQSFPANCDVHDTTAAGDSFNGGFLASLATGSTPESAASYGHTLASIVVSQKGSIIDPAMMPG